LSFPLPGVGKSVAGPPGTAEAELASDNDNPAAPMTGRVLLRSFRFEACFAWDMWSPPITANERSFFWASLRSPFEEPLIFTPSNCSFLGHVPKALVQSTYVAPLLTRLAYAIPTPRFWQSEKICALSA